MRPRIILRMTIEWLGGVYTIHPVGNWRDLCANRTDDAMRLSNRQFLSVIWRIYLHETADRRQSLPEFDICFRNGWSLGATDMQNCKQSILCDMSGKGKFEQGTGRFPVMLDNGDFLDFFFVVSLKNQFRCWSWGCRNRPSPGNGYAVR